jgi:predicted nucleotidyltransferase
MRDKPTSVNGYSVEETTRVRRACLYLATKLGDLIDKAEIVVVGGLVPTLTIDESELPQDALLHVGTLDLDLALALRLLESDAYEELAQRLRQAGFEYDANEMGNDTLQRWRMSSRPGFTVDFLVPTIEGGPPSGAPHRLKQMAAIAIDGLQLAFEDCLEYTFENEQTIENELVTRRSIWICGPAAFVALKALAFRNRGENKDAYDLYYLLHYYDGGVEAIVDRIDEGLLAFPSMQAAIQILHDDFLQTTALGPQRVAAFLMDPSEMLRRAVVADVQAFLDVLRRKYPSLASFGQ